MPPYFANAFALRALLIVDQFNASVVPWAMIRRVALVGLPASGKSTVGQALARLLTWPFMDLDSQIEADASLPVAQIFSLHGEAFFRSLESQALARAAGSESLVLATGGGCVELAPNRWLLSSDFYTVWLDVDPALAWERSLGGGRPLLSGGDARRMRELAERREAWYRVVSGLRVAVQGKSPLELAKEIHGKIM